MKREIKFRGWDAKARKMVNNDWFTGREYDWLIEGDDWFVMQYTGLKDKNGKEIYGEDIIKYHEYYEAFGRVKEDAWKKGVVVWDNDKLRFQVEHKTKHGSYQSNFYHQNKIEIIGNIYENPELRKGLTGL